MIRKSIITAFNEFISREQWDLFLTITFAKSTSSLFAKRRFKYFVKHLNSPEQRFFNKFVRTWIFFEKDGYRNSVHIHALLKGVPCELAVALEKKCHQFFGESKVKPYEAGKGASHYLARKYPLQILEDYDYLKINSRLRIRKGGGT